MRVRVSRYNRSNKNEKKNNYPIHSFLKKEGKGRERGAKKQGGGKEWGRGKEWGERKSRKESWERKER